MSRYLAIDVDAHGLFVAAAAVKGGHVVVEQALAWSEDAPPLTLATAAALGSRLRELLKQAGIKPAPTLVCIGRDRVIPKVVTFPPTPPAEEPAVVRFQAIRELTDAPDDVVMDYFPIGDIVPGGEPGGGRPGRKEAVQAIKLLCETAGLKATAITRAPLVLPRHCGGHWRTARAVARCCRRSGGRRQSLGSWGEFTVLRGTELLFTRFVPGPRSQASNSSSPRSSETSPSSPVSTPKRR